MGQKELKLLSQSQLSSPISHINISRNIFDFQYIIGRGGFWIGYKGILKSTKIKFELKEMQNHTFTCDFLALGVIGYEFCIGHRSYLGIK